MSVSYESLKYSFIADKDDKCFIEVERIVDGKSLSFRSKVAIFPVSVDFVKVSTSLSKKSDVIVCEINENEKLVFNKVSKTEEKHEAVDLSTNVCVIQIPPLEWDFTSVSKDNTELLYNMISKYKEELKEESNDYLENTTFRLKKDRFEAIIENDVYFMDGHNQVSFNEFCKTITSISFDEDNMILHFDTLECCSLIYSLELSNKYRIKKMLDLLIKSRNTYPVVNPLITQEEVNNYQSSLLRNLMFEYNIKLRDFTNYVIEKNSEYYFTIATKTAIYCLSNDICQNVMTVFPFGKYYHITAREFLREMKLCVGNGTNLEILKRLYNGLFDFLARNTRTVRLAISNLIFDELANSTNDRIESLVIEGMRRKINAL